MTGQSPQRRPARCPVLFLAVDLAAVVPVVFFAGALAVVAFFAVLVFFAGALAVLVFLAADALAVVPAAVLLEVLLLAAVFVAAFLAGVALEVFLADPAPDLAAVLRGGFFSPET